MFALPSPRRDTQDAILQARIVELHGLGYIVVEEGKWCLTEKGWRTLSAAADKHRVPPHRQTKLQIENELEAARLTGLLTKMLHL